VAVVAVELIAMNVLVMVAVEVVAWFIIQVLQLQLHQFL
jgi:hypothetical protein